jgi:hypothetical protein
MVDEQVPNAPRPPVSLAGPDLKAIARVFRAAALQAAADLDAGDLQGAERRAKTLTALAQALGHITALGQAGRKVPQGGSGHDVAGLRARLERRLARYLAEAAAPEIPAGDER